tara:strand:- start:1069 stop:1230 length:162 start_codon:yes stop_codon:yes gene_type:complete
LFFKLQDTKKVGLAIEVKEEKSGIGKEPIALPKLEWFTFACCERSSKNPHYSL